MRRKYDPEEKSSKDEKSKSNKSNLRGKTQLLTQALERAESKLDVFNTVRQLTTPIHHYTPTTNVNQEWQEFAQPLSSSQVRSERIILKHCKSSRRIEHMCIFNHNQPNINFHEVLSIFAL